MVFTLLLLAIVSSVVVSAEHVWPVSVEAIDGKNMLVTPGNYRLCLTVTDLTLVALWSSPQLEIVIPVSNCLSCFFCCLQIFVARNIGKSE